MSFEAEQHLFITGKTNTGKTTWASKYYESSDGLNIFFNVQEEYCVEEASDIIVYDTGELEKAIQDGETHICFNPVLAGQDIDIMDIAVTIRTMFAMGVIAKREAKGRPEPWCSIWIDEVQEYGEKQGHPVIHRLLKRGLGYGVRARTMSQRPADVSHTILTQSLDHIIFYVGNYDHPYFKNYKIPMEEHIDHLMTDGKPNHNYVHWNGYEIEEYQALTGIS